MYTIMPGSLYIYFLKGESWGIELRCTCFRQSTWSGARASEGTEMGFCRVKTAGQLMQSIKAKTQEGGHKQMYPLPETMKRAVDKVRARE